MNTDELKEMETLLTGGFGTGGQACTVTEAQAGKLLHLVYDRLRRLSTQQLKLLAPAVKFAMLGNSQNVPPPDGQDRRIKFQAGDMVRHIKSGRCFEILLTPRNLRQHQGEEPAYSYSDGLGNAWCRVQSAMEDGRFEKVTWSMETTPNKE